MRLPDPTRSYAVLIGVSTYQSAELPNLPAVRNNLADLALVLTDPLLGGMPHDRCIVVRDPTSAREVYRTLRQYAEHAEDTLLVYFAGHGLKGVRNELYLTFGETEPHELPITALAYDALREILTDGPAENKVVILDCCFSGQAVASMSGSSSTILGQLGIEGTYTLTSAPANDVSLAPEGARHTAFTGELLALLRSGVPGAQQYLTYGTVYRRLRRTMAARDLPLPQQRGTGTADSLALTRNAAYLPGQQTRPPGPTAPGPVPSRPVSPRPFRFGRRAAAVGTAAAVLVAATVIAAKRPWHDRPEDAGLPSHPALSTAASTPTTSTAAAVPEPVLLTALTLRPDPSAGPESDPTAHRAVPSLTFSPNGEILAASLGSGQIQLWRVSTWEPIQRLGVSDKDSAPHASFSPDGKMIAGADYDGHVRVWEIDTGRQLQDLPGPKRGQNVDFSPHGGLLASAHDDKSIRLWDLATGNQVRKISLAHDGVVRSIAFSPDGNTLASGGYDGQIHLWNPSTGEKLPIPFKGHGKNYVVDVTFNADGSLLASAGHDEGKIWLWNTSTGEGVGTSGNSVAAWAVAFGPGGQVISAHTDGIRRWNTRTMQPIGKPLTGGIKGGFSVAVSVDGLLAGAGSNGLVNVWRLPAA
ncbi:caspase, EACC1-associated type [Catellatospora paridis]|uniref:caspase, EACC1-associated type n=1 Tax=Catellatospora paridis TaxID=1617086 RepID=UPI0012D3CFC7|nr:caspase family protein [Catellatospora paridis]